MIHLITKITTSIKIAVGGLCTVATALTGVAAVPCAAAGVGLQSATRMANVVEKEMKKT